MRVKGDARANFEVEKELDGKSWVHSVDWSGVIYDKMNLSTTYPKHTPTSSKNITYHQLINSIAEQIMTAQKSRFRTISEVFRCALHLGIQVLWHIIKENGDIINSSRGQYFFDSLASEEDIFIKASIVDRLDFHMKKIKEAVDSGKISEEDGEASIRRQWGKIPSEDQDFVLRAFRGKFKSVSILDMKQPVRDKYRDILT